MSQGYRYSYRRLLGVIVISGLCAAAAFWASVLWGEESLSLAGVLRGELTDSQIFYSVRLPRVVLAAVVGASLAAAGTVLQSLTRNALADPYVLGVSGGAALGATVALAFGFGGVSAMLGFSAVSLFAWAGAVAATVLVLAVGRLAGGNRSDTTLLAGVIFNAFALAAIIFIKALVSPDRLGEVLFWLAGQLGPQPASTLWMTGVLEAVVLTAMWLSSNRLNVLSLGEDEATAMGIDVRKMRWVLLGLSSLAVAAAVALAGLVGFVGLLVPHLARLWVGPDARLAIPASIGIGAAFLMLADLGSRALFNVFNTFPPVGVMTALLGAPAFLWLLMRNSNRLR